MVRDKWCHRNRTFLLHIRSPFHSSRCNALQLSVRRTDQGREQRQNDMARIDHSTIPATLVDDILSASATGFSRLVIMISGPLKSLKLHTNWKITANQRWFLRTAAVTPSSSLKELQPSIVRLGFRMRIDRELNQHKHEEGFIGKHGRCDQRHVRVEESHLLPQNIEEFLSRRPEGTW